MFFDFLYELRRRKVPVGTQEAVALAGALEAGLHDSSLDGFYHVARALLVHSEAHLDAFDQAFLYHFHHVEEAGFKLAQEFLEWLKDAQGRREELTPEEQALLDKLDFESLQRMFEERLREQRERHDGGNRWIGTEGTSPFGNRGAGREGFRVGGQGGGRKGGALRQAEARFYRSYRDDMVLDIRQLQLALRKLRIFAREGAADELDLDGTIERTGKNAGELEIVIRPPRRPNTRVILMMDVGGSMDPYADLVSRLFSAASKATHFKELRTYYFHNCVYGRVYKNAQLREPLPITDLLAECGKHYKLICVGDASMARFELMERGGSLGWDDPEGEAGVTWLLKLAEHFERSAWLNPEPVTGWHGTIDVVRTIFHMFPLTLEGLGEAVNHLVRGSVQRGPRVVR